MTQSAPPLPPTGSGLRPRKPHILRTISALMLREISTTYGRSALGYLWAILEPAAGILLLTFVFSMALRSPPMGTNFALFYATGFLPFVTYMDISQKVSQSLRFSRPLLFYPGVTFLDALLARVLLNMMTQAIITTMVLTTVILFYDVDVILAPDAIALSFAMAAALGAGVGTLNCYLLTAYPIWERAWSILTRPLFLVSCIFFLFDGIPQPFRDYLWWNPLVHVVGGMRAGIYVTYDATYVSPLYVFSVSLITAALGLMLLRRYHSDILN